MRLRPHPYVWVSAAILPVAATAAAVWAAVAGAYLAASLTAAVAVFLVPRIARLGVECDDDAVKVHNLLRTRTIPRRAIDGVGDETSPVIRWTTRAGRVRTTGIHAFGSRYGGEELIVPVAAQNAECMGQLAAWEFDGRWS